MEWFKFYGTEYLSDPKMEALNVSELGVWVTLLALASRGHGVIKYLTEERLLSKCRVYPNDELWEKLMGVLVKFEKLNMVELDGETVTVKNWAKYQDQYLTNAERQKKYRDRHKSNATVTEVRYESNARREENRKEYIYKNNSIDDVDNVGKKLKPYFKGNPVVYKHNKPYVISSGEWLEFVGKDSELVWK